MSASERRKGADAEREVARLARSHGFAGAARNLDQVRDGGADILGIAGVCLEVKRTELAHPWNWWAQVTAAASPTEIPVVAFRRSSSPWLAIVPLDELLALLRHRERA
jgi:hypothetical protein